MSERRRNMDRRHQRRRWPTTIMTTMLIVSLILLTCLPSATSTTGYDSSGSCNPRPSRRGRAQLLAAIPCDLTIQAYCNLPGTAYPWNAVRRFVHENQGLMKRMYGDTRHISILKTEFEKNEIDVDDIEIAAARYSRGGNGSGKGREDRKSKYNFSDHSGRLNDVLIEPHFRPTTTTTTSSTTITPTPPNTTDPSYSTEKPNHLFDSHERSTMSYTDEIENLKNKYEILEDDDLDKSQEESVETNSIYENTTEGHSQGNGPISYNQEKLPENQSSTERTDSKERSPISSTLKIVKVEKNSQENESATSGNRNVEPIENQGDMIILDNEGSNSYRETSDSSKESHSSTTLKSTTKNYQPLDRVDDFSAESSEIYTDTKTAASSVNSNVYGEEKHKTTLTQSVPQQQQQQQPPPHGQTMMEGHLYQDSVQKNNQPVQMTGRGVNACPVKEEVVAPFWANNTRGEVLALLNLYPFEQYVHWEKCTHEHKQMYCREGCRCEQQYRLHRLLAYDPHNECRGIFSDWFRFPSCCICKCYDIPNEFRVTSRSPRSPREAPPPPPPSPVEEAEHNLHKAVYEHATEDWYRVRRDAESKKDFSEEWLDNGIDEEDFDDDDLLDLN